MDPFPACAGANYFVQHSRHSDVGDGRCAADQSATIAESHVETVQMRLEQAVYLGHGQASEALGLQLRTIVAPQDWRDESLLPCRAPGANQADRCTQGRRVVDAVIDFKPEQRLIGPVFPLLLPPKPHTLNNRSSRRSAATVSRPDRNCPQIERLGFYRLGYRQRLSILLRTEVKQKRNGALCPRGRRFVFARSFSK